MSGMTGASMLRTRRKDVNIKPNRKLDRKSSRGMLYENEELRLRTININAEVERGQTDIKKLKRENDQLKREIAALRYEYERLDSLLRERRSSAEHSDDSVSVCSVCPDCASADGGSARTQVAFNDLSVVPEEEGEGNRSGVESPCDCEACIQQPEIVIQPLPEKTRQQNNGPMTHAMPVRSPIMEDNSPKRTVDVLVHGAPPQVPQFFQSVTSPPQHITTPPPPPPGFVLSPYQTPRFHTGGNVEDLLGEVQSGPEIETTIIHQNSIFMCNTRRVTRPCCCQRRDEDIPILQTNGHSSNAQEAAPQPKNYVTEKNIELTYDYPRSTPVIIGPDSKPLNQTTTEVASTVVFVERKIPARPKKFDFFFRSRSAPVGENEEPVYATVNKLPKRLRKIELANLEKEVAYKTAEPETSARIEVPLQTDSEQSVPSQIAPPLSSSDTSPSEREKSQPQRPDTPKVKKRKRFSLTFKKRERKRRDIKNKEVVKNGTAKNGGPVHHESDSERLIEHPEIHEPKPKHCTRHRPRNTMSSSSSAGARYKRDSYQEMTSHSEHERTNSVYSSMNSLASACTHKSRKLSAAPAETTSIPWCGCWGAGCI